MGEVAGQGHREETAAWEWLKEAGPGQRQSAGETDLHLRRVKSRINTYKLKGYVSPRRHFYFVHSVFLTSYF